MEADRSMLDQLKASVLVFMSLAGLVCGMTLLFLGMRAVMEVGGSCADGGPYVSARPCPDGVPLAIMGGIFGGVSSLLVYLWQTFSRGIAGFALLAWPALFLSLGWNFLEFGLDPPGGGGWAWGWLVCAVTFGVMGSVPLVVGARPIARAILPIGSPRPALSPGGVGGDRDRPARRSTAVRTRPVVPDDLVDALQRLVEMRDAGVLTEDEFARAKRRILEDGP